MIREIPMSLTLLLESCVIRKDVQRKRVLPRVDELDRFVKIVDGEDGQNRRKDFTGRSTAVRITSLLRSPNPVHSLAHQRVIRTNVPDDRRSDIFRLTVGIPAKDDSSLGVIQQFLDPVEAPMIRETSDVSGFRRAIRIKLIISRQDTKVRVVE